MRRASVVGVLALVVGVWGCGTDVTEETGPAGAVEETGIALSVDVQGGTDVVAVEFEVRECWGPKLLGDVRELEDMVLPGMIADFEEEPFDPASKHLFADFFALVEPGCYDVYVQPLRKGGEPSKDCAKQQATELTVVEGITTEVVLVANCKAKPVAGLDVVAALNHPPVIEHIEYGPSKFAYECEMAQICVTAYDPNSDPMEFTVTQVDGPKLWEGPGIVSVEQNGPRATACMLAVPVYPGTYQFRLDVFDLGWVDGKLTRFEEIGAGPSRSTLTVPLHTNWDIEQHCYDPEEDLYYPFKGVRTIDRLPGCVPIWPPQFFCSDFYWPHTETSCPDGEFAPETVYPSCEGFPVEEPVEAPWL